MRPSLILLLAFIALTAMLPLYAVAGMTVPVEPKPVPTVSAYGLLALAGGLAALGAWKQRRRNK